MSYAKMKSLPGPCHTLVLGRVSTTHQDSGNIEAGYQYAEKALVGIFDGELVIKRVGEVASGMLVERRSIQEALDLINSGWPHLVLMEDLSKAYRNPGEIYRFVYNCVDHGIRVIAVGDHVDTYEDNWEPALASAVLRHGMHIPDTRRRIRRTSAKAFPEGGMVFKAKFGYRKLSKEEAATGQFGPKGLRITKVDGCTHIFQKLREMVIRDRRGPAALADWLNDQQVPLGRNVKRRHWTGKLVISQLRDPILYGLRQYPKVNYITIYATGKSRREKNPNPQTTLTAELAHMTEAEWREMNAVLDELGGRAGSSQRRGKENPRHGVARHKSIEPLQHARCICCGDFLYSCNNSCVKCQNSFGGGKRCWNHVHVDCERARTVLIDILLSRTYEFPGATEALLNAAWEQINVHRRRNNRNSTDLDNQHKELTRQIENVAEAIQNGAGRIPELVKRMKILQRERDAVRQQQMAAESNHVAGIWPASREQLQVDPRQPLLELARTSFEFSELMRKVFPRFLIQPVQALDCGLVRPRALLQLDLGTLLPPGVKGTETPAIAPVEIAIDLFDPPVHIQHLPAVLALKASKQEHGEKSSLAILAAELKINRMTVKRALGYAQLMALHAQTEPYLVLHAKPDSASRWTSRSRTVKAERAA